MGKKIFFKNGGDRVLKVGDYVNGLQVYETGTFGHNGKTFCRLYGNVAPFYEDDIKSIVTKEQFESMEYKVGENQWLGKENLKK